MARGVFLKKNGEKYYPAPYMPIGSIYLTVSNDNPSKWFGGTWEKMSGGYLYACANSIGNSSYTGTNAQGHTLTVNEIPSHRHVGIYDGTNGAERQQSWGTGTTHTGLINGMGVNAWNPTLVTGYTGGGQAHSHNIAYIGVWCWKRIA